MTLSRSIRWLCKCTLNYRLSIVLSTMAGILNVAASLIFIWSGKQLIDIATARTQGDTASVVVIMVTSMLFQILFSLLSSRRNARTEILMRNTLVNQLFTHIMESKWQGRSALHTADVTNRLNDDVKVVSETMCQTVPATVITLIRFVAAFVFMTRLDLRLACVLVVIMPVAIVLSKGYIRRMRRLTRSIRSTDSSISTHLQENLQHRPLITTMEQTENSSAELTAMQNELEFLTMNRTNYTLFSRTMVQAGFAAGYLTAFLWGIFGLRDATVTFGAMTAFLQLVAQVQRPVVDLSRQLPTMVHALTAAERLEELEELPTEQKGEPIKLGGSVGIELQNVDYTYPDGNQEVIHNLSFNFRPSQLTAIVGATGAGKSTLMRLVMALITPTHGHVMFYNSTTRVEASPLTRCNVVYVPQGNTLINGTVRDNLLLGNPLATRSDMEKVLHIAVADFVLQTTDGLDMLCGELGTGMSEGQAQRIAIARALLREGSVIIMDEPTSSLDQQTETLLLERLSKYVVNRTVIIVTHRPQAALMCNDTLRID